jgi:hypothetical protein
VIAQKLDAIMAYPSQLNHPLLERRHMMNSLAAYSEFIGMPKKSFSERYWHINSVSVRSYT